MIAKLQAELSKQSASKRRMEEEHDDASLAEPGPRKLMRTGGEVSRVPRTASRLAQGADGRRAEVAPRQKGDIISRVQFSTRSREDKSNVKDKALSPHVSRSPSPGHRCASLKDHRCNHALFVLLPTIHGHVSIYSDHVLLKYDTARCPQNCMSVAC